MKGYAGTAPPKRRICGNLTHHKMKPDEKGYPRCVRCGQLGRTGVPREALIWEHVNKNGPDGCWIWEGLIPSNGYGIITMTDAARKYTVMTHRWAYEQLVGPIPKGYTIDHLCRVRACMNPDHLQPVPHKINLRRAPRNNWCKRGHPLRDSNLYHYKSKGKPKRRCRECMILRGDCRRSSVSRNEEGK